MANLSLYLELIRLEFLKMLAYRSTSLTGILNYTIQAGAYYFLWGAIYQNQHRLGGLSKEEMITYLIIAWVVRAFYFNSLDRQIASEVRDGRIATELIRPYNFQLVKIARAFGEAIFRLFFFTLPSAVLFYVLVSFKLPHDVLSGVMFFLSMLGAFFINAQICFLTGILAFFTNNSTGIIRAKSVLVDLLSGLLIPISFYPHWAKQIIAFLPFQAISYLPNLLYLGKYTGFASLKVIGIQLLWGLVLFAVNTLVWRSAVKQLTVQGG